MSDTTHAYRHASCKYVTWLITSCSEQNNTQYDMVHSYLRHDSFTRVTWLIYNFEKAQIYVWRDSLLHVLSKTKHDVTWLIYIWDVTWLYVWHDSFTRLELLVYDLTRLRAWRDSFMCVTWLRMCDLTYSYAWHDLFLCVTWLIQMCDMAHTDVWHDLFTCVTWLIHMCDMTYSYWNMTFSYVLHKSRTSVWHDLFTCMTWLLIHGTWLIHMCDMTQFIRVTLLTHKHVTWRIFLGDNVCRGNQKKRCDMTHVIWWRDSLHLCDMMGSAGEGVRGTKHNVGSCDKTHSWIIYKKTNRTWAPGTWFIDCFPKKNVMTHSMFFLHK